MRVSCIILVGFLLTFNYSCKKKEACADCDLYKNTEIRGRLYYQDTISGSIDKIPLGKTTVYLANDCQFDATNHLAAKFIITAQTDSAGFYVFPYRNDCNLWVYSQTTLVGTNTFYSGRVNVGTDTAIADLVLMPDSNTGILVSVSDLDSDLPLNSMQVFLYRNIADTANNANAAFRGTTNVAGNIFFPNTPGGTYFGYIANPASNLLYNPDTFIVTLAANAAQPTVIKKKLKAVPGYTLTGVVKLNGIPQQGVAICLASVAFGGCVAGDPSIVTDATGKYTFNGLKAGKKYFLKVDAVIGSTYVNADTATPFMNTNEVLDINLHSYYKWTITTRLNGSSSPQPQIPVYISTDPAAGTIAADSFLTTGNTGQCTFTKLTSGIKYYVTAKDSVNGISVKGRDSLTIAGADYSSNLRLYAVGKTLNFLIRDTTTIPYQPISAVRACLYTNNLNLTDSNCVGAVNSASSGPNGHGSFSNLDTDLTYYLSVYQSVNQNTFIGQTSAISFTQDTSIVIHVSH